MEKEGQVVDFSKGIEIGEVKVAQGADFAQAKVFTVADPGDRKDRWSAYDGKNIALIGPAATYYISLADVVAGKTALNTVDVSDVRGSWPSVTSAQMANGHMYFVPLSNKSGVIKVFYKETPTSKSEEIYSGTCALLRYADSMSMDLDEQGNGYIFLQGSNNNGATKDVVRLHVTKFKTVDELVTLPHELANSWTYDTVTKIEESGEYIHSGRDCNPCLIDKDYKMTFDFKNNKGEAVAEMKNFASIRIINFNGKRYMFGVKGCNNATAPAVLVKPQAYVYDVSNGKTAKEGIVDFLNSASRKDLYNVPICVDPGTYVIADYSIEKDANGKDAKLYLFAAAEHNGFKVIEVPAAK